MDIPNQPTQDSGVHIQTPLPGRNSNNAKLLILTLGGVAVTLIAIGAYLLGTKQSQPVIQNSIQPSPIPSPTSTDETVSWKTYHSEKFEFRYPTNWKLASIDPLLFNGENNEKILSISFANRALIGISFCGAYPQDERCEIVNSFSVDWGLGETVAAETDIDGNIAMLITLYKVTNTPREIFRQILATFKFTDQNQTLDTSNWKTYTNEKYRFKLKLPPGFELEGPRNDTSSDYFYIRQSNNVPDGYLRIYNAGSKTFGDQLQGASKKDILINGVSGIEYKYTYTDPFSKEETSCSIYQLKTSSYVYEFSGYEGCINNMPTALKILNTFMIAN